MMSKEANVRAILECNFTGFKDEIIDTAVELICDLECEPITSPSQHWAKQAENFGEIAMNEIDKARSCEDCISREEVKSEIRRWLGYLDEDMISRINVGIDRLPSVTPKAEWIPCSERMPEIGSEVLVCFDFKGNRSVYISDFFGDGEFHGLDDEYLTSEGRKCRKAVAWMPLPQPYKAESEDEYKELINKLDGHDAEQLKWWLEYLNRVTDILENEISETKVKIEKMKETSVPSFEYIDKSRGYILGLRTAIKIILKERKQ